MGSLSSEPTHDPMKVGTTTGGRMGYIRQNPTDSRKLRASASVRTGWPTRRHFCARACRSSVSVIFSIRTQLSAVSRQLDPLECLVDILHGVTQRYRSAMRARDWMVG